MKPVVMLMVTLLGIVVPTQIFGQLNWVLKSASNNVENVANNGKYLLVNQTKNAPLKYGKRSADDRLLGCTNIVWGSRGEKLTSSNFVNIVRKPGNTGPIKTGELVAIRFEGGGFLNYEKKKIGVNLGWVSSDTKTVPYIWEIRYKENKIDAVLKTNTEFAIFCHENEDWLAYCKRSDPCINLGWISSCSGCKRSGYDWARDYLPKAKVIVGDVKKRKPDGEDLLIWCSDL